MLLAPSAEMASDVRLWRFAVATGFKMDDAATMYLDALSWRRDRRVDAVRDALVAANPGFFGGGSNVLEQALLGPEDRQMMHARPRTYFKPVDTGSGSELLLDALGNLVYIEVPASVDPAAVHESVTKAECAPTAVQWSVTATGGA